MYGKRTAHSQAFSECTVHGVFVVTDEETGWPPDISTARHYGRLYACYLLSRVLHTHMRAFVYFLVSTYRSRDGAPRAVSNLPAQFKQSALEGRIVCKWKSSGHSRAIRCAEGHTVKTPGEAGTACSFGGKVLPKCVLIHT
jgi:hypothetical protein